MTADENKTLVRRLYAEIDAGNADPMDELVEEDYVDHNPPPFLGYRRVVRAQAGLPDLLGGDPGTTRDRRPDRRGRRGRPRLTAYRHEGELPGPLPPTHAEIRETAVAIHRLVDGRIVEHWSDRDDLALMQQLGAITLPGG